MKTGMLIALAIILFSCNAQKWINNNYEINKNETFEVSLTSNPTTGYSWKWIKGQTSKIVDSISVVYIQDKAEPNKVGVGGNELWKFKGKEAGIDTLIFEYCRSWEKNSVVESKKIIVKVK